MSDNQTVWILIVGLVYGVFNLQLAALKMLTEYRDQVLGLWPDKVAKNKYRVMIYENDWQKLWIFIMVSDCAFGGICLVIPVIYREHFAIVVSSLCAAVLLFTAFGGMLWSGRRDRRMMLQVIKVLNERPDDIETSGTSETQ